MAKNRVLQDEETKRPVPDVRLPRGTIPRYPGPYSSIPEHHLTWYKTERLPTEKQSHN